MKVVGVKIVFSRTHCNYQSASTANEIINIPVVLTEFQIAFFSISTLRLIGVFNKNEEFMGRLEIKKNASELKGEKSFKEKIIYSPEA